MRKITGMALGHYVLYKNEILFNYDWTCTFGSCSPCQVDDRLGFTDDQLSILHQLIPQAA